MIDSRQRGFSLFGLGLMALLISILAVLLLKRLYYYQEVAEKARVELTLKSLTNALKVKMGQMMIDDRAYRWGQLAEENPFAWFDQKPADYCGEVDELVAIQSGCWVYRPQENDMAYKPINTGHLETPNHNGLLRFRVKAIATPKHGREGEPEIAESVRIEPVERYRWLE